MSIRVNADDLRELVAGRVPDSVRERAIDELRHEVRWQAIRQLGGRTGTWRGRRVVKDDRGPMSSGYIVFAGGGGYPPTDTWDEVVWDDDPRCDRIRRLLDDLRLEEVAKKHGIPYPPERR